MGAHVADGYQIWGIDNVVYGPVDLPTLVGWVHEERVTANTWVYELERDAWVKAAQLPVLKNLFSGEPGTMGRSSSDTQLRAQAPNLKPGSLRRIKVFAGLSDEQIQRFIQYMELKEIRQFTQLAKQGDPGDAMYLILQGEIRVRLMIGGKETILATLSNGEFVGEISLYDNGPRSADVIANNDSILLKIAASAFQKVVEEAPDLAAPFLFGMGRTLTGRIRADNKRYRDSIAFARGLN